ncbi:MAG TPA: hypothetical protein VNI61_03830 [Gemmatimonadales bacterium]|nr:hypothetical protein [Gemmatimonadales bacterium]
MALLLAAPARPGVAQEHPPDTMQRRWLRPAASLMVPGSGQFLAGQDRGAVYVAAELFVLFRYFQLEREGNQAARAFRRLAFEVARRAFTTVRRDTVFEYYEQMQRFAESGEFDRDPGDGFQPESDVATYNGSVWLLARRTFWADPDAPPDPTSLVYQRALEFYRTRAVGPDFRWSWRGAALEHQVFRETIRRSDRAFRRAQVQLGFLLANHVASAVDALISSRLAAAVRRPARLEAALDPGGGAWVRLRVAF